MAEKPIPFAWCGKPTGVGSRVVTTITGYSPDTGFHLGFDNMDEKDLLEAVTRLDEILKTEGAPPVDLNVPDGLDWSVWGK